VNRTRITANSFIFDVGIAQFYEEGQLTRETEILVKVKSETMLECCSQLDGNKTGHRPF
jgi:hypothetical protein